MLFWEKIKDIIPKLVDIKNQLAERNIYIGSTHVEINLPPEIDRSVLQGIAVTHEWEREYTEKLRKKIEKQEDYFSSLPEEKMYEKMAVTSASTAVEVISGRANIKLPAFQVRASGKEKEEKGEWSPSVQYTTGDSSKKYAQVISVDEAKYTLHQKIVKVFFDFSVDLKKVPSGSALAIGGLPFTVDSRNVYEFKVHQTGLNHSEDLTVSARRYYTWFDLLFVTDGSEGSVRFWGYIVYDCA